MYKCTSVPIYYCTNSFMSAGLLLSELVKAFVSSHTYPNLGPPWDVYTPQIGLSAPQGCGKTTVVESLEYLFKEAGKYVFVFGQTPAITYVPSPCKHFKGCGWNDFSCDLIDCNTSEGRYCAWVKCYGFEPAEGCCADSLVLVLVAAVELQGSPSTTFISEQMTRYSASHPNS